MRKHRSESGLSLIELLVAMAIFLVISAAIFALISQTQARYRNEQQVLDSLQSARIGVDQIVREVHNAGYPPANTYSTLPADPTTLYTMSPVPALARKFAMPFRGYVGGTYNQGCVINAGCTIPDGNHLSIEEDLDPYNLVCPNQVEIIDYQLVPDGNGTTSTLQRRVSSKPPLFNPAYCLPDPAGASYVPLVENVVNAYQSPAVNVFSYVCDDGTTFCNPQNIHLVYVTLMVRATQPDIQTHQVPVVTIRAVADRLNPAQ
jgi:prepilin-type N-terminal cleavage/methylation domain-containing protein